MKCVILKYLFMIEPSLYFWPVKRSLTCHKRVLTAKLSNKNMVVSGYTFHYFI